MIARSEGLLMVVPREPYHIYNETAPFQKIVKHGRDAQGMCKRTCCCHDRWLVGFDPVVNL